MYSHKTHKGALLFKKFLKKWAVGDNLLDVGCGELEMPIYLEDLHHDIHGIDPLKGEDKKFNFKVGIAEELPYDDDMFDNIVFATSLDHVKDFDKTLKETRRAIRPGGRVLIWNRVNKNRAGHERIFTEKQLTNLFPDLIAKEDHRHITEGMFFCYNMKN